MSERKKGEGEREAADAGLAVASPLAEFLEEAEDALRELRDYARARTSPEPEPEPDS